MITWERIEIMGAWPKGWEAPPVGVVRCLRQAVWPAVHPLPPPLAFILDCSVVVRTEPVPWGPSCLHSLGHCMTMLSFSSWRAGHGAALKPNLKTVSRLPLCALSPSIFMAPSHVTPPDLYWDAFHLGSGDLLGPSPQAGSIWLYLQQSFILGSFRLLLELLVALKGRAGENFWHLSVSVLNLHCVNGGDIQCSPFVTKNSYKNAITAVDGHFRHAL